MVAGSNWSDYRCNNNGWQKKKNNKQDEKRVVQSRRVRNGVHNNKYFLLMYFYYLFQSTNNSIIMEKKNGLSTVLWVQSRTERLPSSITVRDETHAYQRAYSKTMNTGGLGTCGLVRDRVVGSIRLFRKIRSSCIHARAPYDSVYAILWTLPSEVAQDLFYL